MRVSRIISRIALLSLVAAAFVGLTEIYGTSAQFPLPGPRTQAERRQLPASPEVDYFLEFIAGVVEVALFALAGRLLFRMRLSPAPRNERPISLKLKSGV